MGNNNNNNNNNDDDDEDRTKPYYRLREILVVDWSSQSPEGTGSVSTSSLTLTPVLLKRVQPDGLNVSVTFNPVYMHACIYVPIPYHTAATRRQCNANCCRTRLHQRPHQNPVIISPAEA